MIRKLTTPGAVIDALGGTAEVAKLTGKTPQAVSNWRTRGLPGDARTYAVITAALRGTRRIAAPELFGIAQARAS